jgi:tetratricopeptide (TPR) repeat protein
MKNKESGMKPGSYAGKVYPLLLLLAFILSGRPADAQSRDTCNAVWLKDLEFVTGNIATCHPNPFFRIGKKDFDSICQEQRTVIEMSSADEECLVALMKVVASLRDGHTHINPINNFNTDMYLPFRFFVFEDGIYVISTVGEYRSMIGSRLTGINDVGIGKVVDRMNSIIPSDNDIGRMNFLPMYIVNMGFLKGLGIVDSPDEARLWFLREDGTATGIDVRAVKGTSGTDWFKRSLKGPGDSVYLFPFENDAPNFVNVMLDKYENYRFDLLEDRRTLIMQVNQLVDQPGRPFRDFQDEFWALFEKEIDLFDRFILDLRLNTGGNGQLVFEFVKEVINHEKDLSDKDFVVITGRQTYSAAIILVSQLKTYTNAIFVGEPMGGPLHLWSTALQLGQVPSGNFEFHVASMEFDLDLPAEKKYLFPPQIPVATVASDFLSGKDGVLEYIMRHDLKEEVFNLKDEIFKAGVDPNTSVLEAYSNGLIDEENLQHVKEKARRLDHVWGCHTGECGFYPFGNQIRESYLKYEMLIVANDYARKGKTEYAEVFYELLTIMIPDYVTGWYSFADFLIAKGETDRALLCYLKIRQLDPDNKSVKEKIKSLQGEEKG